MDAQTDRQTGRQDEFNSYFSQFCEHALKDKNNTLNSISYIIIMHI